MLRCLVDRRLPSIALALLCLGCTPQEKPAKTEPEPVVAQMAEPPTVERAAAHARRTTWSQVVDTCVVVRGYVSGGTKTDPTLGLGPEHPAGDIDVELASGDVGWPFEGGALVELRGTVIDKHDLRVLVPTKEEAEQQGIPMPTEAEIDAARTHYVLSKATPRALRTLPQIEAELEDRIGETVDLPGVLWSLNGHWWFNHDGLALHLDALDQITGWNELDSRLSLHGRAMVVRGRLDRRPMPRIDQIVLKPDRDLAEAFVVEVQQSKSYPLRPIEPCPPSGG